MSHPPDERMLQERLTSLKSKAPDAFSRLAIDGALHALADRTNPLRLNFFSSAMRVLFEHLMMSLAPVEQVTQCPWFSPQRENGLPTRWQSIIFAIQGGLTDSFTKDKLGVDTAPLRKRLLSAIDKLSKHVHGRADTIVLEIDAQHVEAYAAIQAHNDFLEAYHECRSAIVGPIQQQLDDAAVDALINETILEVDELATHHCLDEVYVDHTSVKAIGPTTITFRAEGSISVTLQWGSNSDLRRGDGAELGEFFPFYCDFEVPLEDPWDLSLAEPIYVVDTSDWHEAMKSDEQVIWTSASDHA